VIPQGPTTIPITTTRLPAGSSWEIYFSDGTDPVYGTGPLPASVTHTFNPRPGGTYFGYAAQSVEIDVNAPDGQQGNSTSAFTVTGPYPSISSVGFGQGYTQEYVGWSPLLVGRSGYADANVAGGAGHRISSVALTFGDGTGIASVPGSGGGELVASESAHTYTSVGDHVLTATVKDSKGLTRSSSAVVSVVSPSSVTTPATATATHGVAFTLPVTAAAGANDQVLGWTVDWSDGDAPDQSGLGAPPATLTHTYAAAGSYSPYITITTMHGIGAQSTTALTVS
jgi:hypothetical protein